jgi:imidazole glycerol-phosphate synthase subunit HisF
MLRPRVIPCLLWKNGGLYKTRKFKDPVYVGDPINAIKIFNEKEVDELVLFDIEASRLGKEPDYAMIREVASECFMPLGYAGGIRNMDQISKILSLGVEKIIIQSAALHDDSFIKTACRQLGSSTIVVVIDYKKNFWGKNKVVSVSGSKTTDWSPADYAKYIEELGAGEIILQSVDRDGMMEGYDKELIKEVVERVSIPVVCAGGAGNFSHIEEVLRYAKPSGAAAGSMFVFQGKHRAVLISYPTEKINSLIVTL